MPDDDNRPRITRTTSVFPRTPAEELRNPYWQGPVQPPGYRRPIRETAINDRGIARSVPAGLQPSRNEPGLFFIPAPPGGRASRNIMDEIPEGFEFVRAEAGGILVRRKGSARPTQTTPTSSGRRTNDSFYRDFLDDQVGSGRPDRLRPIIEAETTTDIGVSEEQLTSVASPLDMASVDPNATFLFDRGGIIDPETGRRTGVLASRGVFGSADSLERQLPAGQDVRTGTNENVMTISAGVLWLRNLAARDKDAYNRLVVLLRNAGYGNLPDDDAALPLNGYTNQVGAAFALAANDLAQAGQGGDTRTLLEYLTDRGQGYADYLAQQEADRAAAEEYQPIDRQYQDPTAVKAAAKAAAVEALGRALTDEEEARFEAHFRAQEDALYDAIDAAGEAETAFRGYAPDLSAQADAFVDENFDQEAFTNRVGQYAQSFMRLMGVGG